MKSFTQKTILLLLLASLGLLYHISQKQHTFTTQSKENRKPNSIKNKYKNTQSIKTVPYTTKTASSKPTHKKSPKTSLIYIQLAGAIKHPGVYHIQKSSPLFKVIQKAGGATKHAMLDELDLTKTLIKSQKIKIPAQTHTSQKKVNQKPSSNQTKININTASLTALITLPGIGPKTAQDIIDYRQKKGRIHHMMTLKEIPGIGNKKLEKLKSLIYF